MSNEEIVTPGFQSSELLANLKDALQNGLSAEEKAKLLKQVKCLNLDGAKHTKTSN
jgi:hypothetical protein